MGWGGILARWPLVVADLARLYHLDLTDPAAWGRPWAPVRGLVLSLLNEPTSRLRADLGGGD